MLLRSTVGAFALAAALATILATAIAPAWAFDDAQYPNLKGQWLRARPPAGVTGQGPFDPDKSWGVGQQAPLTPEYQKVFAASLADQAAGGQGGWTGGRCLAVGMPAMMTLFRPMEMIVLPEITYIRIDHIRDSRRRIYTDGRDWPKDVQPSYDGYSIGKWLDTTGSGRYDTLEAETRFFKGPRAFEPSGLPLAADNETIVKERFYVDKSDPDLLHNDLTVIDHALTRPWTVAKRYQRQKEQYPIWPEDMCVEGSGLVFIGNDMYFQSADGQLMPSRKDQPPPDLTYFKQTKKQ
ncbi:MAG TPA: hypothetical protein VKW08_28765 [Xanthobacteraceae bacterium]|nr:hypothetical protein [Xanthobacteraceae bacterium]